MSNLPIQNQPNDLSMTQFRSVSERYGGLARSCRYLARINPIGSLISGYNAILTDLPYLCETTELPGRKFNSVTMRYYGPSFKLPFQSEYDDINMTFLCRQEGLEREFFDDWMTLINPTDTFDFRYRDDYRAEIEIFQFQETAGAANPNGAAPKASYLFTILNAYPVMVNAQPVAWADDQFLRLGITFTYTWWTRKGRDPGLSTSAEQPTTYYFPINNR